MFLLVHNYKFTKFQMNDKKLITNNNDYFLWHCTEIYNILFKLIS